MKQLFIDLLTKCVPNDIGETHIKYKFDVEGNSEEIYICWEKGKDDFKPKTQLFIPFEPTKPSTGYGSQLIFYLYWNSFRYDIEFSPIEINEVQHLIYQIFHQFQINKIQMFKTLANKANNSVPQTPEEQFETAQEAVAENVSE